MSNPLFSITTTSGYSVLVGVSVSVVTPAAARTVSIDAAQQVADGLPPMWIPGKGKQLSAIEAFCEAVVAQP